MYFATAFFAHFQITPTQLPRIRLGYLFDALLFDMTQVAEQARLLNQIYISFACVERQPDCAAEVAADSKTHW